jgi:hypothetical protein
MNESIYTLYQKNSRSKLLFKKTIYDNVELLNDIFVINNIIDMLVDYDDFHMIMYIFNLDINLDIRYSIYKNIIQRISNNDINNNYRKLFKYIIKNKKFDIYFDPTFIVELLYENFEYSFVIIILKEKYIIDKTLNKIFKTSINIDTYEDAITYILEYLM